MLRIRRLTGDQAQAEDQLRNDKEDAAAKIGRRHQCELVIDVRRALVSAWVIGVPLCFSFTS